MEGRSRKYGGKASPERSRVWMEAPPPVAVAQKGRKVPVVYYLCRNRHLEHPHFIEVPISSPEGLYLRDVIKRLIELRGKGMPSMYSWSCKRSYKNGFVWHDLCEDDLILPAQGNEYVLKGSELLDQSPPDRVHHGATHPKLLNMKTLNSETPSSSKTQDGSSSNSPTTVTKEAKTSTLVPPPPPPPFSIEEDEQSPRRPLLSENFSPGPLEFRIYKANGGANASTQTDDGRGRRTGDQACNTCTRGVSTDDGASDFEFEESRQIQNLQSKEEVETGIEEVSPPPTSSSASSSCGKTETLESLIRAEARKMNSFRILEEEEVCVPTGPKMKATSVLMQLITCGSLTVKDHHSFGFIPTYRPRFSHVKFPSPMFAGSMMLGELDCLSENPRLMGLRLEDKEYFSGSLVETKKFKEEEGVGAPTLKRSSSYNEDRSCKSPDSKLVKEKVVDSPRSKCLPRTIKMTTPNKQYRNGMMRSPMSDCSRNSSAGQDSGQSSQGGSKRITDTSSVKGPSTRLESFKEEKEKVIKIEERLPSGARVIIQSRTRCDESEDSSSS